MILAIAHRGFSARFPENGLAGMEAAIAAGADLVETDARLSADGVAFCAHDPDLTRLAGDGRAIAETPAAALVAVPLAGGGRLVPLLAMIEGVAGRVPVLIDVKSRDPGAAPAVLRLVEAAGRLGRAWFGLRSAEQVSEIRRLAPAARCLAFVPTDEDPEPFITAGAAAVRVWEGLMEEPSGLRLFGRIPVWVTAGGPRTGRAAGDVGPQELDAIVARGAAAAVLLNDPTLLSRRKDRP